MLGWARGNNLLVPNPPHGCYCPGLDAVTKSGDLKDPDNLRSQLQQLNLCSDFRCSYPRPSPC